MQKITTILLDVGGTLVNDDFIGFFMKTPELRKDVLEVLLLLKDKYNLYLATRYPLALQEKILKYNKLEKIIELVKETPPFQKPDPNFFLWLLDKIKAAPEKTVMVGDSLEVDIIPAKSVGLKTIWLCQYNSFALKPSPTEKIADWEVKTFKEMGEILLK